MLPATSASGLATTETVDSATLAQLLVPSAAECFAVATTGRPDPAHGGRSPCQAVRALRAPVPLLRATARAPPAARARSHAPAAPEHRAPSGPPAFPFSMRASRPQLANLCVLADYADDAPACLLYRRAQDLSPPGSTHGEPQWRARMPWLYYGGDAPSALRDAGLALRVAVAPSSSSSASAGGGLPSVLSLVLNSYSLNGTWLGLTNLTNQLQLCGGSAAQLGRWQEVGVAVTTACDVSVTTDLAALSAHLGNGPPPGTPTSGAASLPAGFSPSREAVLRGAFHELYIRDADGAPQTTHPQPSSRAPTRRSAGGPARAPPLPLRASALWRQAPSSPCRCACATSRPAPTRSRPRSPPRSRSPRPSTQTQPTTCAAAAAAPPVPPAAARPRAAPLRPTRALVRAAHRAPRPPPPSPALLRRSGAHAPLLPRRRALRPQAGRGGRRAARRGALRARRLAQPARLGGGPGQGAAAAPHRRIR